MAAVGCNSGAPQDGIGQAQSADFVNGSFDAQDAGIPPTAPWVVTPFLNKTGVTIQSPQTYAGLNLAAGGTNFTTVLKGTGTPDPTLTSAASFTYCRYGAQCALVNQLGKNTNTNQLTQTMTVVASDVDPQDNQVHIRAVVAPILENPGHTASQQPYFFVQMVDVTQSNTVFYENFNFSNQTGIPWKPGPNDYLYTDWQLIDVPSPIIKVGDQVEVYFIAAGCQPGGHVGELYVDGVGTFIPGLIVGATGPAQINVGGSLTYNLIYENNSPAQTCSTSANCSPNNESCVGGVCAENGVVITFNTPPNTTFVGFTPPAGATCTTPAVGSAGAIVCTFSGPIAPGSGGGFTITVKDVAAVPEPTLITAGNYSIQSSQEGALLGNPVNTILGCTSDNQCSAGNWCDAAQSSCTPQLGNGVAIPVDPTHNPTITGMCTPAVGLIVCQSGVCDTTNSECGYANGDGPCTTGSVCQSGACDPDGKCGFKNGDGTCTSSAQCRFAGDPCATNGLCGLPNGTGPCLPGSTTVCQSGQCSVSGVCEAVGSCLVDGDCTSAQWCQGSTHTCVAKLANGTAIPNDPTHMPGALMGSTCTVAAGTSVCVSGVCDANGECGLENKKSCVLGGAGVCQSGICDPKNSECGYADGDGPCTSGAVCQSNNCDTASGTGVCEEPNGCQKDNECTAGNWCDETTQLCTPQGVNGAPVGADPAHSEGPLPGACITTAPLEGSLTCASGVCDPTDSKCGIAIGDSGCTVDTQCRNNGVCGSGGVCVVCTSNAQCSGATPVCNTTTNTCVGCTDSSQCSGATPICDTGSSACVACTGDNGSGTMDACPTTGNPFCFLGGSSVGTCGKCATNADCTGHAGPVCNATTGLCISGCAKDTDCPTGNWCQESTNTCVAQGMNGAMVGTDPGHAEGSLSGMCDSGDPQEGPITCVSGICDPKDNECGLATGDGTCTTNSQCRSNVCGPTGTCVGCTMDTQCSGSTPVCNTTTNMCVGCTDSSQCSGDTPVCDGTSRTCVACTGDNGASSTDACPTTTNPFCFLSGSNAGSCGKCSTNSDCSGHSGGAVCDPGSGLCTTNCTQDSDCSSTQWCNAVTGSTGTCQPKIANGSPLPTMPSSVATCSTTVGSRVCVSGVCDPKTNDCGLADGDGTCTTSNQCVGDDCDTTTGICTPSVSMCTSDSACPAGDYCDTTGGACKPKQPDGKSCSAADQCTSGVCAQSVCGGAIIGSGGLICAAQPEKSSGGEGAAAFGLLAAVVGLARRRRRAVEARP